MKFYTIRQVADMLGITPSAVYRLIDRGTLGCKVIGSLRVVPDVALAQLMADPGYQKRSRGKVEEGQETLELTV